MAAAHKHARKSTVSPQGSEAPKRKVRRSTKAASAEPAVEVSFPSKPDIVESIPPTVEATTAPPPMPVPNPVLEFVKNPVPESPAPIVEPVYSPVAAANPTPEHLENLAQERLVWGVAVAVSWTVTVVALLRLAGVI